MNNNKMVIGICAAMLLGFSYMLFSNNSKGSYGFTYQYTARDSTAKKILLSSPYYKKKLLTRSGSNLEILGQIFKDENHNGKLDSKDGLVKAACFELTLKDPVGNVFKPKLRGNRFFISTKSLEFPLTVSIFSDSLCYNIDYTTAINNTEELRLLKCITVAVEDRESRYNSMISMELRK